MDQNQEKQNKKDFLLGHYVQISEHLRESDRNRNILLAVYSALIAGTLGFIYSTDKLDQLPKLVILGFLIVFGIGIAFYTTFARAWHCEFNRVVKAIHKSFLNADLLLYKAAKEIKKEDEDKHRHYFNIRGTEFIIFVLILLFVFTELVLVIFEIRPEDSPWRIYLSIISFLLVFGVGIVWYGRYLDKREAEFPEDSWCIIKEKEEKMTESDLERIEARLEKIEGKLDKSQKFSWSSSLYLLGVTAFGAGIGLLVCNQNVLAGWLLALVGLVISIIGVVSLFRHGRFRKWRIRN
jgi:MFS family permease